MEAPKRTCARKGCDNTFVQFRSFQIFCSRDCRKKHGDAKRKRRADPSHTKKIEAGRVCHDCGKPCTQYRCDKCRAAWRARHGVNASGEDGSGYDSVWW